MGRHDSLVCVATAIALFFFLFGCGKKTPPDERKGETPGVSAAKHISAGAILSANRLVPPGETSAPLTNGLRRLVKLSDHEIKFSNTVAGRVVEGTDLIAVEKVRFGLNSDPDRIWTFAQMESLSGAGALGGDTRAFPVFQRAFVKGDSASVAALVAKDEVNWRDVPPGERYPANGIHGKYAGWKGREGGGDSGRDG